MRRSPQILVFGLVVAAAGAGAAAWGQDAPSKPKKKKVPSKVDLVLKLEPGKVFQIERSYSMREVDDTADVQRFHNETRTVRFEVLSKTEAGDYEMLATWVRIRGDIQGNPNFPAKYRSEGEYDSADPEKSGDALAEGMRVYTQEAGRSLEITVTPKGRVTDVRATRRKGTASYGKVYQSWRDRFQAYLGGLPDKPVGKRAKWVRSFTVQGKMAGIFGEVTQTRTVTTLDTTTLGCKLTGKLAKKVGRKGGKKRTFKDGRTVQWSEDFYEWYGIELLKPRLISMEGFWNVTYEDGIVSNAEEYMTLHIARGKGRNAFETTEYHVSHTLRRVDPE